MMKYLAYLRKNIYDFNIKNWFHYMMVTIQVIVLGVAIFSFVDKSREVDTYGFSVQNLDVVAGVINNETLYIDEEISGNSDSKLIVCGPYISVPKGSYRLRLEYHATESSGYFFVYDAAAKHGDILADEYMLSSGSNQFETEIYIEHDVSSLEFRIFYLGAGVLEIGDIVLEETNTMWVRNGVYAIMFILVVQLLYYMSYCYTVKCSEMPEKKYVYIGLSCIWSLVSYPLFVDYLYWGIGDISYHMNRIEGIKDGLLSGQFPVRIQPDWWNHSGYAASVFYPDASLYVPAVLRILGVPVQEAYRIYLLMINGLTCVVSYYAFSRITRDRILGLIGTLLYAGSMYRFSAIYLRGAIGEVGAMIFIPLVIYGFVRIIRMDSEKEKLSWLPLVLGMTGLVNSHIISLEMTCLFLVIMCIIFAKKVFVKMRIITFAKAAMITLLINAWVIVPFIDYFLDEYQITLPIKEADLQKSGTFISQLFMTFPQDPLLVSSGYVKEGICNDFPLGVGLPILVLVAISLMVCWGNKNKKEENVYLGCRICGVGILALIFSLHIFPWGMLWQVGEWAVKFFYTIQYSWRYYVIALPFICAGGLLALKVYRKEENGMKSRCLLAGIVILAVCMILNYNDTLLSQSKPYRIYTPEAIDEYYEYHYLPIGADTEAYLSVNYPFSTEWVDVQELERDGMNMTVEVTNDGAETILTIPYVFYEGYEAVSMANKESFDIIETEEHMLGVVLPNNYKGIIQISFKGKWFWRIAEIISVISVLGVVVMLIYDKRKNSKLRA